MQAAINGNESAAKWPLSLQKNYDWIFAEEILTDAVTNDYLIFLFEDLISIQPIFEVNWSSSHWILSSYTFEYRYAYTSVENTLDRFQLL